MPEAFVPAACDACERVWLAQSSQNVACPYCHGPGFILPGESYKDADLPLFALVEGLLSAARLSESSWTRLWATLSNVSDRGRRPQVLLLQALDELPALQCLQQEPFRDRALQSHALGMVLLLVSARLRFLGGRPTVGLAR